MEDEQYKRYRKMVGEDIKCLHSVVDRKGTLHFLISGASGTRYKVSVGNKGALTCSCPDFKHGAKDGECVCKHCLFLIYRHLRLFEELDHPFFKRRWFTADEIQQIRNNRKNLKTMPRP